MTGIVERLRRAISVAMDHAGTMPGQAVKLRPEDWNRVIDEGREAAARIEALEAENAELLDQREAAMIWGDANSARVEPLQAEIARLTEDRDRLAAQVKALREALRPFALISSEGVVKATSGHVTVTTCVEYFHRARTLLSTTEPKA